MGETKVVTSLHVVTDTETGQQQIGDIEGGAFDKDWLKSHISDNGSAGLLRTIAWMNFQVVEAQREVSQSADEPAKEIRRTS